MPNHIDRTQHMLLRSESGLPLAALRRSPDRQAAPANTGPVRPIGWQWLAAKSRLKSTTDALSDVPGQASSIAKGEHRPRRRMVRLNQDKAKVWTNYPSQAIPLRRSATRGSNSLYDNLEMRVYRDNHTNVICDMKEHMFLRCHPSRAFPKDRRQPVRVRQ
jgi:hypothetical protein